MSGKATSHIGVTTVALLAAAVSAGCGRVGAPQPVASPEAESPGVLQARSDSIRRPYTDADIRFMTGMIGHHAQAVLISGWAPTHGAGPSVIRLAERIVNAQQDEIALMRQWLRDRRQPVPEAAVAGMAGAMPHGGHEGLMPGMLSHAQLMELDTARGRDFDQLFLRFMIQHHRGALVMVKELLGSYGAAQDHTVFKFASDAQVDQATEIARMEKLLAALLTSPE